MGRLFELRRPIRALLAMGVALGSGLISYGVVLNPHAPAAALILAAVACFAHVAVSKHPRATSGWVGVAGTLAPPFAATIDPTAIIFLVLFAASRFLRCGWARPHENRRDVPLSASGHAGPLTVHAAMTMPITGDMLPSQFHHEMAPTRIVLAPTRTPAAPIDDIDEPAASGWWNTLGVNLSRIGSAFFGGHGIFSHFPIMLLGIFGVAAVMHRHWPLTTKTLATATLVVRRQRHHPPLHRHEHWRGRQYSARRRL